MSAPVDRSITVSAPQSVAQRSFSTSSSIDERTAELPMLALIFTWKARPMTIGSSSGWLMLAGMIARPARHLAPHQLGRHPLAERDELHLSVISPRRAYCSWVTAPVPRSTGRRSPSGTSSGSPPVRRPVSTTARARIQGARSGGSPCRTSWPWGPLASYTRSGGSPPDSAISRIGTRTPRGPLDDRPWWIGETPRRSSPPGAGRRGRACG